MDVDVRSPADKSDARVVIITNLSRNVVESHLKTIFSFYGLITKVDLPTFVKCEFICKEIVMEPTTHKYSK
jgi:RNA-binding protein with serine-rich domain 1